MIIQYLLTIGLVGILAYVVLQSNRAPIVTWTLMPLLVFGLVLVWNLKLADRIAVLVGARSGADVVTYCWIVISLVVALNLHLRMYSDRFAITALARAIALQNARWPQADQGPSLEAPGAPVPQDHS